ncbi:MAG TPA: hypothetical protein VIL18_10530 [Longimicrobiales bacterium]
MRRFARWLVVAAVVACGEDRGAPPVAEEASAPVEPVGVDTAAVEPVETEIFMREEAPEVGPGRAILHVLVPAGATQEQIRQALMSVLLRTAEEDTTLVALRAVVYVLPPVWTGEATLSPTAWGEWLPLEGWERATPGSRHEFHRIYTYFGASPPW